jgi:hypothetical protein
LLEVIVYLDHLKKPSSRRRLPVIEVKNAVDACIQSQPETFLAGGIKRLWESCAISFEKLDDHLEKLHTLHLSQTVVYEVINKFTSLLDFASCIRGLSGEYAAILNISRTGRVALMYLSSQSEKTLLRTREQSLSRRDSQSAVRRR